MDITQIIYTLRVLIAVIIGFMIFYISHLIKNESKVAEYNKLKFIRNFGVFPLVIHYLFLLIMNN